MTYAEYLNETGYPQIMLIWRYPVYSFATILLMSAYCGQDWSVVPYRPFALIGSFSYNLTRGAEPFGTRKFIVPGPASILPVVHSTPTDERRALDPLPSR